MAKRYDIEANAESSAPIDAVWRVLVNQQAWPTWAGFDSVVLEAPGSPTPDGLGSIRRTKLGRTTGREEVTRFDEPHTYGYRLLSGLDRDAGRHSHQLAIDVPREDPVHRCVRRKEAPGVPSRYLNSSRGHGGRA
jgi:hypothetical protein